MGVADIIQRSEDVGVAIMLSDGGGVKCAGPLALYPEILLMIALNEHAIVAEIQNCEPRHEPEVRLANCEKMLTSMLKRPIEDK